MIVSVTNKLMDTHKSLPCPMRLRLSLLQRKYGKHQSECHDRHPELSRSFECLSHSVMMLAIRHERQLALSARSMQPPPVPCLALQKSCSSATMPYQHAASSATVLLLRTVEALSGMG